MNDPLGPMYADGARHLQDTFDSRRLADRLVGVTLHDELNEGDIELIRAQRSVLVATVDVDGWPDVSYKGGDVGFVRVIDSRTIELPSYDGNGMFRTLGNIIDTGRVALLFLDNAPPRRLRLHGTAVVDTDPAAVAQHHGAQAVVRITIGRLFPNRPRYIHAPDGTASPYVPRADYEPPVPEWKAHPLFRDALPADRPGAVPTT